MRKRRGRDRQTGEEGGGIEIGRKKGRKEGRRKERKMISR
jgi:hypothetical protein